MSFALYNPFFSPPLYEIDNVDFQENVERLYFLFDDLIDLLDGFEDPEERGQFFAYKNETDGLIQRIRYYLEQNNIQANTITYEGLRLDQIIHRVEIIQPPVQYNLDEMNSDYSDETPTFPVMMQLPVRTNTVDSVDTSEPAPSSREPSTIEFEEEDEDIIKL